MLATIILIIGIIYVFTQVVDSKEPIKPKNNFSFDEENNHDDSYEKWSEFDSFCDSESKKNDNI